ncbi:MAG: AI-2E family transporter, partial [Halofilum sp. (in: g-proteobacteria)]
MTSSERWTVLAAVAGTGILIYLLQPILLPFLAGALLAYLGNPLVERLQGWLGRSLAAITVFTLLLLALAGLLLLLIPVVGEQLRALQASLPRMFTWAQETALPWLEARAGLEVSDRLALDRIGESLAAHWRQTGDVATMVLNRVTRSGLALAGWVANLALIPVVTFYLLRDWDLLLQRIRDL